MRCCAGFVQYRSNTGNMSYIMQVEGLPPGNMSYGRYITQISNLSVLKDLDHELWESIICMTCQVFCFSSPKAERFFGDPQQQCS